MSIETRDRIIWNKDRVVIDLLNAMQSSPTIVIDLRLEGPDANDLGLYDLIYKCAQTCNYSLNNITLVTCNQLEQHPDINIIIKPPLHLLARELNKNYSHTCIKKHTLKHFGRFVGRSSAPRLLLSTYLDKNYSKQTISTYHFNLEDDYHRDEIGLETLMTYYNINDVTDYAKFLASCPRTIDNIEFRYDKSRSITGFDFSTQLHVLEKDRFISKYQEFFVEVVSETFFNGNTFFITEKTIRPMLLKTPFIVQGPTGFLKNLRKLGFKTFSKWWDEGYDEDPPSWSIKEIIKVIDSISKLSQNDIRNMLEDMQPVLKHNYNVLVNLKEEDFECINTLS